MNLIAERAWPLPKPCTDCGCTDGVIRPKSGQNCLYCRDCGKYSGKNVSKAETGEAVRPVRSRPDLGDGQRERILERDGGECFLCHRRDGILHVAHALSVKDAQEMGFAEEEYMDDENLYAACEECNLGLRSKSMEARIFLRLIQVRLRKNGFGGGLNPK